MNSEHWTVDSHSVAYSLTHSLALALSSSLQFSVQRVKFSAIILLGIQEILSCSNIVSSHSLLGSLTFFYFVWVNIMEISTKYKLQTTRRREREIRITRHLLEIPSSIFWLIQSHSDSQNSYMYEQDNNYYYNKQMTLPLFHLHFTCFLTCTLYIVHVN